MAVYRSKIYVQYKSGSIAKSVKVVLGFNGFLGGMTRAVYTDTEGKAIIEHQSRGKATIYVKGHKVGTINAPGESVVFI